MRRGLKIYHLKETHLYFYCFYCFILTLLIQKQLYLSLLYTPMLELISCWCTPPNTMSEICGQVELIQLISLTRWYWFEKKNNKVFLMYSEWRKNKWKKIYLKHRFPFFFLYNYKISCINVFPYRDTYDYMYLHVCTHTWSPHLPFILTEVIKNQTLRHLVCTG